jgi:5'(3')-deoxyribonucleotidase/uncharacterized protein with PQ loop repeat
MQIRSAAALLGTGAAILSTVAFVPQITKIWRTGGKDVSLFMLWLYGAGVTLWLCYGLAIGAAALSLANAVSIVFAGACLVLKLMKERETQVRMEKKRLRIAIDMDETIADSLKEQIRRYNAEFAETISTADLYGKHLEEVTPSDRREAVRRAVRDESFFDCLDVIDGAKQVIEELVREHEVFIVSAAMEIPESLAAKHRWLRRHFPFVPERNVVFCGNKGIIDADYLIDDEARHFVSFPGTGILFSAPHNLSETEHRRVADWREVHREFIGPRSNRDCGESRLKADEPFASKRANADRIT